MDGRRRSISPGPAWRGACWSARSTGGAGVAGGLPEVSSTRKLPRSISPRPEVPMRIVHEALTFDDVLLEPAYSEILPREVQLKTQLTRSLTLNIPIISAAMDTVTEARLAIALAQEGGIGIIHKNMSPKDQARQVSQVKKFESGVIHDPITVSPDATIRQVIDLARSKNISGVPVVEGEDLVGIVTHRDLRFETQRDAPVSSVMTPKEHLVLVGAFAHRHQ